MPAQLQGLKKPLRIAEKIPERPIDGGVRITVGRRARQAPPFQAQPVGRCLA
jgi:hypothetical protein